MKKIVSWSAVVGVALLAACGPQKSADKGAVNQAMEPAPANMAASAEAENLAHANDLNALEEATPGRRARDAAARHPRRAHRGRPEPGA